MYSELAIFALFVFGFTLIAGRVERAPVSGPIVFVLSGVLLGPMGLGWFDFDVSSTELRVLADLTLATFLFSDAAKANLGVLRRVFHIPSRMLLLGLPGVIFLGTVAAALMFDNLSIYQAAVLGTMLAATDAALGKAVVSNKVVPAHMREGLNLESGLNDGLCVPILYVFIALALGTDAAADSGALAVKFLLQELGIGLLVGVSLVAAGAWLLRWCWTRGWIMEVWKPAICMALAIACFSVAQSLHGSGYIAAFAGGVLFGPLAREARHELVVAAEGAGETLALMTWLAFGAVVIPWSLPHFTWDMLIYALLSLTIIRMLPIYVSLAGCGERTASKLFLGWFGPRGLASIVFAIIVVNRGVPAGEFLSMIVILTVLLSLVAHGVSANPLARWIGREQRTEEASG